MGSTTNHRSVPFGYLLFSCRFRVSGSPSMFSGISKFLSSTLKDEETVITHLHSWKSSWRRRQGVRRHNTVRSLDAIIIAWETQPLNKIMESLHPLDVMDATTSRLQLFSWTAEVSGFLGYQFGLKEFYSNHWTLQQLWHLLTVFKFHILVCYQCHLQQLKRKTNQHINSKYHSQIPGTKWLISEECTDCFETIPE